MMIDDTDNDIDFALVMKRNYFDATFQQDQGGFMGPVAFCPVSDAYSMIGNGAAPQKTESKKHPSLPKEVSDNSLRFVLVLDFDIKISRPRKVTEFVFHSQHDGKMGSRSPFPRGRLSGQGCSRWSVGRWSVGRWSVGRWSVVLPVLWGSDWCGWC